MPVEKTAKNLCLECSLMTKNIIPVSQTLQMGIKMRVLFLQFTYYPFYSHYTISCEKKKRYHTGSMPNYGHTTCVHDAKHWDDLTQQICTTTLIKLSTIRVWLLKQQQKSIQWLTTGGALLTYRCRLRLRQPSHGHLPQLHDEI